VYDVVPLAPSATVPTTDTAKLPVLVVVEKSLLSEI